MKIRYTDSIRLSSANLDRLYIINSVCEDYMQQGYTLTLRQLYYQLVKANVIPNHQTEYTKLSILLKRGRMAGMVDWEAISDRGRRPKLPYCADDVADALEDIKGQYRVDLQRDQDVHVEVWVEKDALSEIFYSITSKYHVRLMVNRGYSSCSAMHDAAMRIVESGRKHAVIIYFGDHDPSGLDMTRDITERLSEFLVGKDIDLAIQHPALNMDQVLQYKPPTNPTKMQDPRAAWYYKKYGKNCWELDALTPQQLVALIDKSIRSVINMGKFNKLRAVSALGVEVIQSYIDKYKKDKDE